MFEIYFTNTNKPVTGEKFTDDDEANDTILEYEIQDRKEDNFVENAYYVKYIDDSFPFDK